MAALASGLVALCPCVDAAAVKEIIDSDLSDARVNNFINFAYYVTRPLSGELGECGGAEAECSIILLLAAHFLTVYERQTKSENVTGEWSVTYLGKEGLGLEASLYGQNAIAMDCSGKLKLMGLKRATLRVIGYEDLEEQTPSDEWYD